MSVINQMLQDLEQRHAGSATPAARVRAVPRRSTFRVWFSVFVIMPALLAGGGAYWWKERQETVPAVVPVSQPAPAIIAAAPPQSEPEPQVLQLAGELSILPAAPVTTPQPEVSLPARVESRPKALLPASAVAEVEAPASSTAEINKEIRQPTPQQRAESAYRLAYAALQQGRMSEAEEQLRQALQHDPRHVPARQALAALLVENRQLERAEQLLQQGLELVPGHSGFAMTLARLQVERGDVAAALATLQRSPPSGEGAEYHAFMAALLQRSERHKEAIEHYQRALRANPNASAWLLGLGISAQADNQNARAADAFRRALKSEGLSAELRAFAEQRLKQVQ